MSFGGRANYSCSKPFKLHCESCVKFREAFNDCCPLGNAEASAWANRMGANKLLQQCLAGSNP